MAPFTCCGVRRGASPDVGPIHLVQNPLTRRRFPLSTTSTSRTSNSSARQAAEIHQIFEATANEDTLATIAQVEARSGHQSTSSVKRKQSMKKIQDVANRVRKTISRDSGMSNQSPKRNVQSSVSHENMQRRRELKRALQGRVQADLVEEKVDGDDGYDEDAVPMKTPRSTWGKEEAASNVVNPRRLSKALKRSLSPLPPSHYEMDRHDVSQAQASRSVTGTLSRMLTVRGSQATTDWNNVEGKAVDTDTGDSKPQKSRPMKTYVFRDESPEKPQIELPETLTPSPLGRSNTVIRNPSSTALVEIGTPTFLNVLGTPYSPDLLPQRMDSISDSVAGREWRLSYVPSRGASSICPHFPETINHEEVNETNGEDHDHQAEARTAREAWARSASGLLKNSVNQSKVESDSGPHGRFQLEHRKPDHPIGEEDFFDGVDGNDNDIADGEFLKMPGAYRRKPSSASTGSVHLYNMRIPSQLASRTLLTSISQPYLQGFTATADGSPTDDHQQAKDKPRRRVSSSGFNSARIPRAWGLPKKYAASSVYSHDSPYITPTESHQGSIMFLNKIADRMNRFGPDAPARDILSVPAATTKHVDVDRLERRTLETSFHSSNESLTNRELAAAEVRISPRAQTLTQPKSSWFTEDFADVSAAIARTNPQRRSLSERAGASNLDGQHSERAAVSLRPRGFRFVPGGEDVGRADTVWDEALREHEQEDAALSLTRLGSETWPAGRRGFIRGSPSTGDQHGQSHSRLIDPLSPLHHHHQTEDDDDLQARLRAYHLPPPRRTPSPLRRHHRRTPTEDLRPFDSTGSVGSWTRFPSHDREIRSSASAGEADYVFARDFAQQQQEEGEEEGEEEAAAVRLVRSDDGGGSGGGGRDGWDGRRARGGKRKSKSKSMTFGRRGGVVVAKLQRLYRVGGGELERRIRDGSFGHRSSVSEGE